MKPTTNTTKAPTNNNEYTSRVFLCKSERKDKDGNTVPSVVLVSFANYWYINTSKNGKMYGRLKINGDWNIKYLHDMFPDMDFDSEEYVTLFFGDRDTEWLSKHYAASEKPSCNRSFIGHLEIQTNEHGASMVCRVIRIV